MIELIIGTLEMTLGISDLAGIFTTELEMFIILNIIGL